MILPKYTVAMSRIPGAGKGLFLAQPVARGSVVVAPADIRESRLIDRGRLGALDGESAATSIRWFEDYCTIDPDWSDECYINHSFSPSGLWHLGFVFAMDDLDAGSELTVDYRLLLADGETPGFNDALTGLPIIGFSWQENLRRSTALLQQITGVTAKTPALDG